MSRLKDLRKEKGFTQVKMQILTGIDQSDYSKIESGKMPIIPVRPPHLHPPTGSSRPCCSVLPGTKPDPLAR